MLFFSSFLSCHKIKHFISNRKEGVSEKPFHSLNTALHVGDQPENVLKNREILAKQLKVPLQNWVFASQTHSDNIAVVNDVDKGKGAFRRDTAISDTDAFITRTKGVLLCVQMADCVPILLYDPVSHSAAAIHAGWKSTVQEIAAKTVLKMRDCFGAMPENIVAGIGPANGPKCYAVGNDVYDIARSSLNKAEAFFAAKPKESGKYFFDQWKANATQLEQAGVLASRIEIMRICTHCHTDDFFSARAEKNRCGRFAAGIMLH